MEPNDPPGRVAMEDLSDCRSDSSHSESQLRAFQDYERVKELNLSVEKSKEDAPVEPKDYHLPLESGRTSLRFDEFETSNRNLPLGLSKGKDFGYIASALNEMAYPLDRSNENEESIETSNLCRNKNPTAKDLLFNLRETRHKNNTHAALSLDRYNKDLNFAVSEKDIKDFRLLKNYSLDRMKDFNLSLDRMRDSRIGNFALERLRGGAGILENPSILEHNELKNIQMQPRDQDLEAIALERMRRSHLLGNDLAAQNLSTQLPHPHSITQMQHSQQQQQHQAKSFTIDAILGLRNNQREKRSQQQQYRKHQGQEGGAKNASSTSCPGGGGGGGGGKLKRVRTIFTAEQLERLEGEFARQQYMVGPERLYLAHALRLTEAQVKVWFQNRRIKWRKHHHEQQSQKVHEFQRSLNSSLEHEDSNETDKWATEPVASYYSSTSYKPQRSHVCSSPTYTKCTSFHGPNPSRVPSHSKPGKEKYYCPSFSSARKNRYDEETGNPEKVKFIDEELANFTEDNAEEDGEEEATEDDREEAGEFPNKDYEEQEADDEIEDESDASPEAHRAHRGGRNETAFRSQRWRPLEQSDTRRICCQQHVPLMQNHSSPPRYYHSVAEHEVPEPLSEEDFVRTSPKSPTRRQPPDYRHWSASRNENDRYEDVTAPIQTTRRARTKPDLDRLIEAELNRTRRCNRCGDLSSKRNELSVKSGCRFDDRLNIPTKGPIGDEPDSHQLAFRGRCNLRHSTKDANVPMDIPGSAYAGKSRRPRDGKSSTIYEVPEQAHVDKLANDYSRASSRYARKSAAFSAFAEKAKRSLHTSHATVRLPTRYVE